MQKTILTLGLVGVMAFFTACNDSVDKKSGTDQAAIENAECKKECEEKKRCEVECKEGIHHGDYDRKEECKEKCEEKCPSYSHASSIKDIDGDGKISKEEYLGAREEMFQKLDTDGDGFISEEETAAHKKAVCEVKCDSLSKEECKKECEEKISEKCKKECKDIECKEKK